MFVCVSWIRENTVIFASALLERILEFAKFEFKICKFDAIQSRIIHVAWPLTRAGRGKGVVSLSQTYLYTNCRYPISLPLDPPGAG